jgi:hypothetical protein
MLAIEAKVDAWEGEDQLPRYEKWLRSRAGGCKLFLIFLTPDGRPSEIGAEEWESLSFLNLVRIFRGVYDELRETSGFHFLRFYLAGVLQDVCNLFRDVEKDDPYEVAAFLRTVYESRSEDANHDASR